MQQTEKYGFNLIEMSDTFSSEALNENARKMAEVLEEKGNCRILEGTYAGTGKYPLDIEVGFAPKILVLYSPYTTGFSVVLKTFSVIMSSGTTSWSSNNNTLLTDTGFRLNSLKFNEANKLVNYAAFG